MRNKTPVKQNTSGPSIMRHFTIGDQLGLTPVEYRAVLALTYFGEMTAGDLAQYTHLTTGAVTGMVDRLEKLAFVFRKHDKIDRRRVVIVLKEPKFRQVKALIKRDIVPTDDQIAALLDMSLSAESAAEKIRQLRLLFGAEAVL